jgi:hypothetical protein
MSGLAIMMKPSDVLPHQHHSIQVQAVLHGLTAFRAFHQQTFIVRAEIIQEICGLELMAVVCIGSTVKQLLFSPNRRASPTILFTQ